MNNSRQPAKTDTATITALYERLSRDDELEGTSNSIMNQRQILEDYAARNGFTQIRHFQDDGYSGTNWNRPSWKELLSEIEAGHVSTVIVKDMSRLGRDYLQVGYYTEVLFRQKSVRFIAVSNNIDSTKSESTEFAPFLSIMAEWFARDTSRKIKTVAHAKGNSGKPLSYNAIYGYRKSSDDKNVWLIDEEPAAVVRRIFQMVLDGMGPHQIARQLTTEKIEKPSCYFAKNRTAGPKPSSRDLSDPYCWCGGTVANILSKPEYCGHTVNFRTYKESYKDKTYKWHPKEDWKIFENTHPAIIDQKTFDTVQRLRETPRRVDSIGEANPLTGLVFCAQCGAKMYNSRQSKEYCEENRFGKVYMHKPADFYCCSAHDLAQNSFKKICSKHFIRTVVIRDLVLDVIRRVSSYVRENEAEFVQKIRETSAIQQEEAAKSHKKLLAKNMRRIAELNSLFQKVYEDNAAGKLSDERYTQLSGAYECEQAELKQQNAGLQAEVDAFNADSMKADRFIEIVRRYTDFDELTTPMLNEFVEKILVHEADKSTGERAQQVDIYLNFIGKFDIPREEAPLTPDELAEQEKRRRKLAYQREANRRWYAKKRAEQAGTLPAPTPEEIAAAEAQRQKRIAERREYARDWARRDRERKRAENSAGKGTA